MCFKTAALPAPSTKKFETKFVDADGALYHVQAVGVREVFVTIGGSPAPTADLEAGKTGGQYFTPEGLREFAAQLNELADKLAA